MRCCEVYFIMILSKKGNSHPSPISATATSVSAINKRGNKQSVVGSLPTWHLIISARYNLVLARVLAWDWKKNKVIIEYFILGLPHERKNGTAISYIKTEVSAWFPDRFSIATNFRSSRAALQVDVNCPGAKIPRLSSFWLTRLSLVEIQNSIDHQERPLGKHKSHIYDSV
jgi:hypothetical protein